MEQIEQLIEFAKKKKEYFEGIDFKIIAGDFEKIENDLSDLKAKLSEEK